MMKVLKEKVYEYLHPRNLRTNLTSHNAKTVYAGATWLLIGTYINCVAQAYVETRTPHLPVLPDIGFDIFPHLRYWEIVQIWIISQCVLTIVRFAVDSEKRWMVLRRYLLLQGTCFILRAISISVTNLPTPFGCHSVPPDNVFITAVYIMTGQVTTCGDVLFSGHAASMTLYALFWHHYTAGETWQLCCPQKESCFRGGMSNEGDPEYCILDKVIMWWITCVGYLLLIATHFHYSVDVFIGLIISLTTFKTYHHYIKSSHLRRNVLNLFFCWYENIPRVVMVASDEINSVVV